MALTLSISFLIISHHRTICTLSLPLFGSWNQAQSPQGRSSSRNWASFSAMRLLGSPWGQGEQQLLLNMASSLISFRLLDAGRLKPFYSTFARIPPYCRALFTPLPFLLTPPIDWLFLWPFLIFLSFSIFSLLRHLQTSSDRLRLITTNIYIYILYLYSSESLSSLY